MISDPAPEVPVPNTKTSVRDAYQNWLSDRTTIRCIMLAIMNDEFSRQFEHAQPEEILQRLKESFGIPDDVERLRTSCAIYNARLREGGSVTDHVLYMIELIERLGKLGYPLHEQLGKDAILNSLPPSYLGFLDHWRLNRPVVNYHGLLGLLQSYERDHQLNKGTVNLVGGQAAGHRSPFGKGKKKKKKMKKVQHAGPSQIVKKNKADKSQAQCYHCGKQGHWRRNCPSYISSLDPNRPRKGKQQAVAGQGIYMITPCSFSISDTTNFVLDTGSPIHIYNSLQGLQVSRRFEKGE